MNKFLLGMNENTLSNDLPKKNLLTALRYFIGKIIENQCCPKYKPSNTFISACTGLIFHLLNEHLPKELIFFCNHSNRSTINEEDLFLFCRKTNLKKHLIDFKQYYLEKKPKKILKNDIEDESL